MASMRDHRTIIDEAGGPEKVAHVLKEPENTVRSWRQRGRISHLQWDRFVAAGWTTLEELAAAAREKRQAA